MLSKHIPAFEQLAAAANYLRSNQLTTLYETWASPKSWIFPPANPHPTGLKPYLPEEKWTNIFNEFMEKSGWNTFIKSNLNGIVVISNKSLTLRILPFPSVL